MQSDVRNFVSRIDRSKLRNNTQRVLLALLKSEGQWVSRSTIRVNSAARRIRDLRSASFGGFHVDCAMPQEIGKRVRRVGQTFYRLSPSSVTMQKVAQVFEGVSTTR